MCRVNGPAKETHPDPETRAIEIYNFDSETGAKEIHPVRKLPSWVNREALDNSARKLP